MRSVCGLTKVGTSTLFCMGSELPSFFFVRFGSSSHDAFRRLEGSMGQMAEKMFLSRAF